jgi:hypothetical protein
MAIGTVRRYEKDDGSGRPIKQSRPPVRRRSPSTYAILWTYFRPETFVVFQCKPYQELYRVRRCQYRQDAETKLKDAGSGFSGKEKPAGPKEVE